MTEPSSAEFSRNIAAITLARVRSFNELWAPTKQEGNLKFAEKTREVWRQFAVHGVFGVDKKSGQKTILNFTDLDGKCALGLLKLAGINTDDVIYVAPGAHIEGRINLDTGNKHGVVVEDGGKTAFFDHHTDDSGRDTSATKIVYEVLATTGLLERRKYLTEFVDFVTKVDNGISPAEVRGYFDSYKTIFGLRKFMKFDQFVKFFRAQRKPEEILNSGDLKWLGLEKRSEQLKEEIERSKRAIEELEKEGFTLDIEKYGKVVIDIDKKIPHGFNAVRGLGFTGYVIWAPKEGSFFVSTSVPLEASFAQGRKIRQTMWIKPRHDTEPLRVNLKEILNELSGGTFEPQRKLKEYLEKGS